MYFSIMQQLIITLFCVFFFSCIANTEKEWSPQFTSMPGDETQIAFSTDGKSIAFSSDMNGEKDIYIQAINSSEPIKIGMPKQDEYQPKWSPDGNLLAYTVKRGKRIFIQFKNLETGQLSQISIDGLECSRPSWSTDGTSILFNGKEDNNVGIYLFLLSSNEVNTIKKGEGKFIHFGFSPDGKYIGFYKRGGGEEDLFAISINDKKEINISKHEGHEWYPHWSPDGTKILFYSTWGDEMTEVWTTDFPDGKLTQISNHISEDFAPVFSPDGSEVVYISKRDGFNDLYVYNFLKKSTNRLNISHLLKKGWPIWSPDGKYIAYSANLEEEHLYRLDISNLEVKRLTKNEHIETHPVVSDDGKLLAYVSTGAGSESNIMLYAMNTESNTPFLQTYHYQSHPQFHPKKSQLGYIQSAGGSIRTNNVFVKSFDDDTEKQLTHIGGIQHFIWSKNGEEIICGYDSSANFVYDIIKINIASGRVENVVNTSGSELPTDISPDGNELLFFSDMDGENKIYRMPLVKSKSDKKIEFLQKGWDAKYSPNGSQIVFVSNENKESLTDVYIMDKNGGSIKRLTQDAYKEASPTWSLDGNSIIFSVQKGDKDIWFYLLE